MYRMIVWYIRGKQRYTKSGFQAAQAHFRPGDLEVSLTGRSFLVTGANSGIGKAACQVYAAKGATIHMVCRSKDRGEEARQELITATGNNNIHLHVADMADPVALKALAEQLQASKVPVHVLVNNAGCMLHERKHTPQGLETNFAVNSFAPYLLTELLVPYMSQFDDPRVINVSSGGMLLEKLESDDPMLEARTEFKGDASYAQQKRQQMVLTRHWTKVYPKVSFYAMHPGWADTPAVREALPEFFEKMKDNLRTAEEGADSLVWLGVCKDVPRECKGAFIEDRQPVSEHLPLAWTRSSDAEEQKFVDWMKAKARELNLLS
eukprot:m.69418 g.69418  ORF g.69418 m.69418 type:complete len:321 (-) comp14246_c0_seq1:261-1223(-)